MVDGSNGTVVAEMSPPDLRRLQVGFEPITVTVLGAFQRQCDTYLKERPQDVEDA